MNRHTAKLIDRLLESSDSKFSLKALEKLFNLGIPFNLPHKFEFLEISSSKTLLKLPYIKKNQNHLGGLHACALATLGEYPAGLSLIKQFGSAKYRLIMRKLEADYFKQARGAVYGEVTCDPQVMAELTENLTAQDQAEVTLSTHIINQSQEVIAVIRTDWQVKNWEKVSFK